MDKKHFTQIINKFKNSNIQDEREYPLFFFIEYLELYLNLKKDNPDYNVEKFFKAMSLYVHTDKIGNHVDPELTKKFGRIPFQSLTDFVESNPDFPFFSIQPTIKKNNIDSIINKLDSVFVYNSNFIFDILSMIKEYVVMPLHISYFLVNVPSRISAFFKYTMLILTYLTSSEKIVEKIHAKLIENIRLKYALQLDIKNLSIQNVLEKYSLYATLILELIEQLNFIENFNQNNVNLPLLTAHLFKKYNLNAHFIGNAINDDLNIFTSKVLKLLCMILQLEEIYPGIPSTELFKTFNPNFNEHTDFDMLWAYFNQEMSKTQSVDELLETRYNYFLGKHFIFPFFEVLNDNQFEIYAEKWKEMTGNFYSMPLDEKILTTLNWMLWGGINITTQTLHFILSSVSDFAVFALKCVEASILAILSAPIQLAGLFKNQEVDSEVSNEIALYQPGF